MLWGFAALLWREHRRLLLLLAGWVSSVAWVGGVHLLFARYATHVRRL